jgi:hypothetical protein
MTPWRVIALAVAQSIYFALAVACYADPTNPLLVLMLCSTGPWAGALIMAMFSSPSSQESS